MTIISERDIDEIAAGSAIYGTGGGGDPYLGKLLAKRVIHEHGPVNLMGIDAFDNDDLIIPIAMVGSPSVILEKLPQIEPMISALRALERRFDRPAKGVVSMEVGGINSTIPFCVASFLGLPLIDGDTMGRAFPELQMTLCTLNAIHPSPIAIADEKGNVFTLEVPDAGAVERLVRNITMDMGGSAYLALYPMTVAQLRTALVPGSISAAQSAGRALFHARTMHADPIAAVVAATSGFCLFKGKVTDVHRKIDGRFSFGHASLTGLEEYVAHQVTLEFQNEFLLLSNQRRVFCSTPDLIVLLDLETGEPITAEQTRFGLRVAVLAIPCVGEWRTNAAMDLVGPRRFGYQCDYVPVERLVAQHRKNGTVALPSLDVS